MEGESMHPMFRRKLFHVFFVCRECGNDLVNRWKSYISTWILCSRMDWVLNKKKYLWNRNLISKYQLEVLCNYCTWGSSDGLTWLLSGSNCRYPGLKLVLMFWLLCRFRQVQPALQCVQDRLCTLILHAFIMNGLPDDAWYWLQRCLLFGCISLLFCLFSRSFYIYWLWLTRCCLYWLLHLFLLDVT